MVLVSLEALGPRWWCPAPMTLVRPAAFNPVKHVLLAMQEVLVSLHTKQLLFILNLTISLGAVLLCDADVCCCRAKAQAHCGHIQALVRGALYEQLRANQPLTAG